MPKYERNPTCSEPSIFEPKDKAGQWYIYFNYRDLSGKRKQFKIYEGLNDATDNKATKRLIAAEMKQALHEKLKQRTFNTDLKKFLGDVIECKPLARFIDEYLEVRQKDVDKGTLDARSLVLYKYSLNHFKAFIGNKSVSTITSEDIEDFFEHKGLMTNSKKYVKTNIGSLYIWLRKKYKIVLPQLPTVGVEMGRTETTEAHSVMSEAEFDKFMPLAEQEESPAFVLCVKLIYHCLVRPIEITRLQVKDVKLERNVIHLAKGKGKNRMVGRYLILDSWMRKYIDSLGIDFTDPAIQDKYLVSGKGKFKQIDLLGDKQLNPDKITRRFNKLRNQLKISKDCTTYSLKHLGNIHLLIKHKIEIAELSLRNGHRNISTTEIYLRDLRKKAPELLTRL